MSIQPLWQQGEACASEGSEERHPPAARESLGRGYMQVFHMMLLVSLGV
jgi:hypothetical protein